MNGKRVRKSFRAYKAFNNDLKCRDFQYEIGVTYQHKGELNLYGSGFHASKRCSDVFNYYVFDPRETRVCEVLIRGRAIEGKDKVCCSRLEIVKELKWHEVLEICNVGIGNSGYRNSGDWNSGHRNSRDSNSGDSNSGDSNSGNWNSGDSNSGNWNSGHRNSGDWNSGHRNSGDWNSCKGDMNFLSTEASDTVRIFNKPCKRSEWAEAKIPNFFYFNLMEWITEGGYLKTYEYKQAWSRFWDKAPESDKRLIEKLPNFDWAIFTELTGIEKPEKW